MLVVFATACWQQRTFSAWAHATERPLRESRPARSATLRRIHRRQPARAAFLARTATVVRDRKTLRFCHVTRAAQPRAAQRAAGTALLPKRSAAENPTQSTKPPANRDEQVNARIASALRGGSVSHGYGRVARSPKAWAIPTSRAAQLGRCTRPRAVRWPGASRLASARRVASRCGNEKARGRVSGSLLCRPLSSP
jgi:hypothetical protein